MNVLAFSSLKGGNLCKVEVSKADGLKVIVANIPAFCVLGTIPSLPPCSPTRRVKLREVRWFAQGLIVDNLEIQYLNLISLAPAPLTATYR